MKNVKKLLLTGTITAVTLFTISTYTNAATVKITGEVVNIRKEASTTSSVVARLSENVECEYVGEKGNWYQIKYKNYVGYVSKDYAKLQGTVSNNQTSSSNNNTQNNNQSNTQSNQQANSNQTNNEGSTVQTSHTQPVNKKLKQNTTIKILPLVHSSNIGNAKTSDTVALLTETSGWSYIQTDEISRLGKKY